jgi:predicted nucleic-acid-binding protein
VEVLLYSGTFSVQNMTAVDNALKRYKECSADFSDYRIIALSQSIGDSDMAIYTFDNNAIKAGMGKIAA